MTILESKAQKWLITQWLLVGGFLFVVLLLQTLFGRYGDKWKEAWTWFLSTILPTLSLMLGVLSARVTSKTAKDKDVDRFPFLVAFCLCGFYLTVVVLQVLISPLLTIPPLALMKASEVWLHPLQALFSLSLGWFFVSK
jgi:hypothetical protein